CAIVPFGACNSLTWGYQLNGGANQNQFTFPGGCGSAPGPNVTIGPFTTPQTLRVFLSDNTCGAIYYSDGLPVDHVIVSGSNPYSLRWADAGGFCERKTTTANNFSGCNFCIDLAISDQAIAATATNISATEGKPFSGTAATFTDAASPSGTLSDFSASIDWGDGTSTAGTITGAGGSYSVSGSHTYASTGSFTITTTITDVGGKMATTTCATVGFSFAPGGGSFVISDHNAAVGSSVTFWGAQWAKDNTLSGRAAPRSFKGFTEDPRTTTCGLDWSTDPGNSTPPPSGPLPAFMGVIVTSSATKTGSIISGNSIQIVVVWTTAGYTP